MRTTISILLAVFCFHGYGQNVLSPEMLWKMGRVSDVQVSPGGTQVLVGVTYYDMPTNKGNRDLYVVSTTGGTPKKITDWAGSEVNGRWHPDGKKVGFLSAKSGAYQWYEVDLAGSQPVQVTQIDGGISNVAYSPKGNYLSFTQDVAIDQTTLDKHSDLPMADAKIIDNLMYRHWNYWNDEKYSHVFYAPYQGGKLTGKPTDIMVGERFDTPVMPFGGPEDISWSPDEKTIAYVSKKKVGKEFATSTNSDIYLYQINNAQTRNLTEGMMGYDTHPVWSPNGKQIAWLSMERDGYEADKNVLHTLELATNLKRPVTKNFPEGVSQFDWSASSADKIYFISGVDATYQLFELQLPSPTPTRTANQPIRQITKGIHNYGSVQLAGDHLIALKQSMSQAYEIERVAIATGKAQPITQFNKATYDKIKLGKVEKRMVKTTDGKDMLTWVIYPPDFDPKKKYPTLLYCQGGPQSAVSQFFSFRWNFQLMAAQGYIIIAPNRRGLPTFGMEWLEQISKDWGGQAIQDYLSAVDEVSKEPFVDKERIGAVGASYGGYSVYMLAGMHDKRFKTFISHCGLFNLTSWYGTTEELFFANWDLGGAYWDKPKPKSYDQFSPHLNAGNWDTPIMVIHCGKDFRVPETEGMQAFQVAQLKGIPSKYLYFPNESHWVQSPQNGLLWQREFFSWLDKWLK